MPVARARAYRSRWLWVPAVAISASAQGTAVVAYEATRSPPKPLLTIRLDDAAASWDFDVTRVASRTPALTVDAPKDFEIAVDGMAVTSGTRIAMPAPGK